MPPGRAYGLTLLGMVVLLFDAAGRREPMRAGIRLATDCQGRSARLVFSSRTGLQGALPVASFAKLKVAKVFRSVIASTPASGCFSKR